MFKLEQTNQQTDQQTGQKQYVPHYSGGGYKKRRSSISLSSRHGMQTEAKKGWPSFLKKIIAPHPPTPKSSQTDRLMSVSKDEWMWLSQFMVIYITKTPHKTCSGPLSMRKSQGPPANVNTPCFDYGKQNLLQPLDVCLNKRCNWNMEDQVASLDGFQHHAYDQSQEFETVRKS
ncbi:hypothetical protein DPMN_061863 [Dreissena polymorpha]|uniref:Uncharacterized protein n=1 Tax=Dreissena polymorpha TaxID=45954 RepID=A0A9D4C871_DREPO|nr:hypothetical protein DPMN_061863 [Dreissena polymorpha]